tara:strand:+ start:400 stop:660 length:261 start_codon:yes stop_codon:yes gene_type:complete
LIIRSLSKEGKQSVGFPRVLCVIYKSNRPDSRQKLDGENYHLIDSFEGLSEPALKDAIFSGNRPPVVSHQAGHFAIPLIEVQKNLA